MGLVIMTEHTKALLAPICEEITTHCHPSIREGHIALTTEDGDKFTIIIRKESAD